MKKATPKKLPGKGHWKDEYDKAAEHIIFDDDGPFRKALLDNDDGEMATALAEELRVLFRPAKRGTGSS